MNVLITGTTGFIGSHLAKTLLTNGFQVVGLHRRKLKDEAMLRLERSGIIWREEQNIEEVFSETYFDVLIHLATNYGRANEDLVIETNINLPRKLLEKFTEQNGKLFLNTDSYYCKGRKVYPTMLPYSQSKNKFLEIAEAHSKQNGCKMITARLEHVYGPKDREHKFIPFIINTFRNNERKVDLTTCDQRRDFVYVQDVCNAFVKILKNHGNIIENIYELEIGTGQTTTLRNFIEILAEKTNTTTVRNYGTINKRMGEIEYSFADLTWTKKINWKPSTSIDEGIEMTLHSQL